MAYKKKFSLSDLNPRVWVTALIVGIIAIVLANFNRITSGLFSVRKDENKAFYLRFMLSQSTTKLKEITEMIFYTMADFGTKEPKLFALLEGLNKHDLVYIYNKFGKRQYSMGGLNRFTGTPLNLLEWFDEELDDEEYNQMAKIWEDAIELGNLKWIPRN